jgi:glycosyltransferase involved in cell wall biosynthesis
LKLSVFRIIFFFFPHHHIGGAERVHLEIIKTLKWKPFVFFDSTDGTSLSEEFKQNAYCFFITTEKRKKQLIRILIVLSYILPITLFGCNSVNFYKTIAKVKNRTKNIDLTHAFSFPEQGIEIISLPYVNQIDTRIVINKKTLEDYKQLYEENGVNKNLFKRIKVIPNGIRMNVFNEKNIKNRFDNFTIGFVGRNSPEKRPEVFFEIVRKSKWSAKVIGDNFDAFKTEFSNVSFFENCNDPAIIRTEFSEISVLVVSSLREGFPLVIMEAMELGIPVISTNVGSIAEHVKDNINGCLFIGSSGDEFVNFVTDKTQLLSQNASLYNTLSLNAREYAEVNFGLDNFKNNYRKLFYEKSFHNSSLL